MSAYRWVTTCQGIPRGSSQLVRAMLGIKWQAKGYIVTDATCVKKRTALVACVRIKCEQTGNG